MAEQESKHDAILKRLQIIIAILAGITTLLIGLYNVKKVVLVDKTKGSAAFTTRTDAGTIAPNTNIELYDAQNTLVASGLTGSAGQFTSKELEAGNYIVKVSLRGYEPQVLPIRIEPKKTAELQLTMRSLQTQASGAPGGNPIKSALEETGAAWIRKLAEVKKDT